MNNKFIWLQGYIKSVEKASDGGYSIEAIASTGNQDRYLETVNPQGWDLKNFKKNPVLLWAHDYSHPPVGKVTSIKLVDNNLLFKAVFADTAFASDIARLYKDKILNAFSVGFIAKKFGDETKGEYTYMLQELLEISCVPVPANAEALVLNGLDLQKATVAEIEKSVKTLEDSKKEAVVYLTAKSEETENEEEPKKDDVELLITPDTDSGEPAQNDDKDTDVEPENAEEPEADEGKQEDGEGKEDAPQEEVVEQSIDKEAINLLKEISNKLDKLSTHQAEQPTGSENSKANGNERTVMVDVESLKEFQKQLQLNDKQNESVLRKVKALLPDQK